MNQIRTQSVVTPTIRKTNQFTNQDYLKAQLRVSKYGTHHKLTQSK